MANFTITAMDRKNLEKAEEVINSNLKTVKRSDLISLNEALGHCGMPDCKMTKVELVENLKNLVNTYARMEAEEEEKKVAKEAKKEAKKEAAEAARDSIEEQILAGFNRFVAVADAPVKDKRETARPHSFMSLQFDGKPMFEMTWSSKGVRIVAKSKYIPDWQNRYESAKHINNGSLDVYIPTFNTDIEETVFQCAVVSAKGYTAIKTAKEKEKEEAKAKNKADKAKKDSKKDTASPASGETASPAKEVAES